MKELARQLMDKFSDVAEAMVAGMAQFLQDERHLGFDGSSFSFAYEFYLELLKHGRKPSKGVYFTPMRVGKMLVGELAIKPGELVLDPCAGLGCLLMAVRAAKGRTMGFEVHHWLVKVSKLAREDLHIFCRNFLREPDGVKSYTMPDAIVLNPPLGKQQGCADITGRMLGRITQLYPKARLAALLPSGYFVRVGRKKSTRHTAVDFDIERVVEVGEIKEFGPWHKGRFSIFVLKSLPK
jgi:tRNA G10  N-methylase Trm11